MLDDLIPSDFDFCSHPLWPVIRLRCGFCAVWFEQFSFHFDVCTRRTKVGCCAITFAISTQQLHFNRDRKVLIFCHLLGLLTMNHDTTVTQSPTGPILTLITYESILHPHSVVRETVFVKQMSKLFAEPIIVFVANFEQSILHPKCITVIITQFVIANFWYPAIKVFPIEKLNPLTLVSCLTKAVGGKRKRNKEQH